MILNNNVPYTEFALLIQIHKCTKQTVRLIRERTAAIIQRTKRYFCTIMKANPALSNLK